MENLDDEKEKLSFIVQNVPTGVIITNSNFKIDWVNRAFTKITGYTAAEVLGKGPEELLFRTLHSLEPNESVENKIESKGSFVTEGRHHKINGEPYWVKIETHPLLDEQEEVKSWIIILTDISKQKFAEEARISIEKRMQDIFNRSPLPEIICKPKTLQILKVNARAIALYGYELSEFLLLRISDLQVEQFGELKSQPLGTIKEKVFQGPYSHKKKSGEIINVEISSFPIEYNNEHVELIIVKDITEKFKLRQELLEERLDKERRTFEATICGQEIERAEIGRELHDNINQMLVTVKMYYEIALKKENVNIKYLEKGEKILAGAIQEIRNISRNLVAPNIKEFGLIECIKDLIDTIQSVKKITINLQASGNFETLHMKIKLMFFRIIQEQLNNILKYAYAKNVVINFIMMEDDILLIIKDDGKGFDTKSKKGGIGLSNIKSRVSLYNGSVEIKTAINKGCELIVKIPIQEIHKKWQ